MTKKPLTTSLYCRAVEARLAGIVIDRASGEKWDLRKLFFPLRIDEGQYAFDRYAERIHHISAVSDHAGKTASPSAKAQAAPARSYPADSPAGQLLAKRLAAKARANLLRQTASQLQKNIQRCRSRPAAASSVLRLQNRMEAYHSGALSIAGAASAAEFSISGVPGLNTVNASKRILSDVSVQAQADPNDMRHKPEDPASMEHTNALLTEADQSMTGKLLWSGCRVLALASAGCGKTTILNRLALFYSILQTRPADDPEAICELEALGPQTEYALPWRGARALDPIPVLIRLRTLREGDYSIDRAILSSTAAALADEPYAEEEIEAWIRVENGHFLLLIDGLDEVPDGTRYDFLRALEDYLNRYPSTMVLMSSRVAGLSEPGVEERLRAMRFHGRTIMPLSEADMLSYCENWIQVTQSGSPLLEEYLYVLRSIQTEDKYAFLRELMRTPLELTVMLQQIVNNAVSPNKWRMFYDSLWGKITSHLEPERQQDVFDDTLLFLGLIAYQLQLMQSMSISRSGLGALLPSFRHLNFQTAQFIQMTPDSICQRLDRMAASIGIIEKNDTGEEPEYTFPIRAYQEFLTAYACCHMRLDPVLSRPDPIGVILPHVSESRWADILGYVISDMENNGAYELDEFEDAVFRNCQDPEILSGLIDDGFYVSAEKAGVLCDSLFRSPFLSPAQKRLLLSCLATSSAYSYRRSLTAAFRKRPDPQRDEYLEALTYAHWAKAVQDGTDILAYFIDLLRTEDESGRYVGAKGLTLIARTVMDEEPLWDFSGPEAPAIPEDPQWFETFRAECCETVQGNSQDISALYCAYRLHCLRLRQPPRAMAQLTAAMRKAGFRAITRHVKQPVAVLIPKPVLPEHVLRALSDRARESQSPVFVEALTELWLARLPGAENVPAYLDTQLLRLVRSRILSCPIPALLHKSPRLPMENTELYELKRLFCILGAFPPLMEDPEPPQQWTGTWQSLLLEHFYDESIYNFDMDQVAFAVCLRHFGWPLERFGRYWSGDICRGLPSAQIRKDQLTDRERNHFDLVKKDLEPLEPGWLNALQADYSQFVIGRSFDAPPAAGG